MSMLDVLPSELLAYSLGFLPAHDLARASQACRVFASLSDTCVNETSAKAGILRPAVDGWAPSRALRFVESRVEAHAHRRNIAAGTAHCAHVLADGTLIATEEDASSGLPPVPLRARSSTRDKATPRVRAPRAPPSPALCPVDGHDVVPISAVAAGDSYTLFTTVDGECFAIGDGSGDGALGLGDEEVAGAPTAVAALAHERIVDVAAGFSHSLFVTEGGDVYSTGWGHAGRLGQGNGSSTNVPLLVDALEGQAALASAGEDHSIVVDVRGRAWTFGSGEKGQLGHADESPRMQPTAVAGALAREVVVAASAGDHHSLFVTANGELYACGCGEGGRLGLGDEEMRTAPQRVPLGLGEERVGVVACAAGGRHSAAVDDLGRVWVWGEVPANWDQPALLRETSTSAWAEPAQRARAPYATLLKPAICDMLPEGVSAVALDAGLHFTLVLASNGECYSLGSPVLTHEEDDDDEPQEGDTGALEDEGHVQPVEPTAAAPAAQA